MKPRRWMKRMSDKRRASQKFTKYDPVYAEVDRRAQGRCEIVVDGVRCVRRQVDRHHVLRDRSGAGHDPRYVAAVCRWCHDLAHARKLVIEPNGDGTFACRIGTRGRESSGGETPQT